MAHPADDQRSDDAQAQETGDNTSLRSPEQATDGSGLRSHEADELARMEVIERIGLILKLHDRGEHLRVFNLLAIQRLSELRELSQAELDARKTILAGLDSLDGLFAEFGDKVHGVKLVQLDFDLLAPKPGAGEPTT